MPEQHHIQGPYESAQYQYNAWDCDGITFMLSGNGHCTKIAEVTTAIQDVEDVLCSQQPLGCLSPRYSVAAVEVIAMNVFPDLLKSYIENILKENEAKSLWGISALIHGEKKCFIAHGDFELLILRLMILNNLGAEAPEFETILGYDVQLLERGEYGSRWTVNGEYIKTSNISKSMELVNVIEQVKMRLVNLKAMADLYERYSFLTLQCICSRMFPDYLRIYLAAGFEKSKASYMTTNRHQIITVSFGMEIKQRETNDDKFQLIVNEVLKKELSKQIKRDINGYEIVFQGYTGNARTYKKWKVNGKQLSLNKSQAIQPEDVFKLINEIRIRLVKNVPMTEITDWCLLWTIQQVSARLFPVELELFFRYFAQEFTEKGEVLFLEPLLFRTFGVGASRFFREDGFKSILDGVMVSEYRNQQQIFLDRSKNIDFSSDVWKVYYVRGKGTYLTTFDFSTITKPAIRNEMKHYFHNKLKYRIDYNNVITQLPDLVRAFSFFIEKYPEINYSADIKQTHLESLIIHLETDSKKVRKAQDNISVGCMAGCIFACSLFVEYLMENFQTIKTNGPKQNYFSQVTFHNLQSMKERTEIIPEHVIELLEKYINELYAPFQRIWLIMMNTGMRFKEVVFLEEDCLEPMGDDGEFFKLRFVPWKVLQARRDRGLDDYHVIVVRKEVAQEIEAQKKDTNDARIIWGLKEIFINDQTYKATIYRSTAVCNAINRLMRKYDIGIDDKVWEFTNLQCRKYVAVELVTNGADRSEVTDLFGHLSGRTTDIYYNEVRSMKLADMNAEFFRKKFQTVIEESVLEKFSEEERRRLYVDFYLGYRERELGTCGKPYSEGPCSKRTGRIECAQCEKLCTGPQKLPKWLGILNNQKKYVANLVVNYEREGILDYQDFREFQAEKYWLDLYQNAVDKINERFEEGV